YVGTNDDLYHNPQTTPNDGWEGEGRLSGASAKQIAVGQNADGRLEIFYVGTNNDLYHNSQTLPRNEQDGWRFCRKCEGLAYGRAGAPGPCPAGGTHDHSGSGNYTLVLDAPGAPG